MDFSIPKLGLVLFVACLVAILSRRLRLPYSVGLMVAGIGLAASPIGVQLPLSRDLIFSVFLPPLVFEAAIQLNWTAFRRELPLTLLLAFPGVVLAAGITAVVVHSILGWSWMGAGLFGILIAATDPVAVIAAFKNMSVGRRLSMRLESESLLNDGAAAVGFGVLTGLAKGGDGGAVSIGMSLLWNLFGGIAVGAAVAACLLFISGRTKDRLVEITLTTLAAYGSFLLAEYVGASGVLATLTAGLVVGSLGFKAAISEAGRDHVLSFWAYAAFLANSVIFILIGSHEAHQPFGLFTAAAVVAVVAALASRAAVVYGIGGFLQMTPLKVPVSQQHVLFWGGLRGAVALALALALPTSINERHEIIVAAFAVVAFSVLVQGVSIPWLVKRLNLIEDEKASPAQRPGGS